MEKKTLDQLTDEDIHNHITEITKDLPRDKLYTIPLSIEESDKGLVVGFDEYVKFEIELLKRIRDNYK